VPKKGTSVSCHSDEVSSEESAIALNSRFLHSRNDRGRIELQFQIKDQEYFLAFVEQEKRWYVFAPTAQGVHRIPVYVDAVKWGTPVVLGTEATPLS
jgi:hypothetical protein